MLVVVSACACIRACVCVCGHPGQRHFFVPSTPTYYPLPPSLDPSLSLPRSFPGSLPLLRDYYRHAPNLIHRHVVVLVIAWYMVDGMATIIHSLGLCTALLGHIHTWVCVCVSLCVCVRACLHASVWMRMCAWIAHKNVQ